MFAAALIATPCVAEPSVPTDIVNSLEDTSARPQAVAPAPAAATDAGQGHMVLGMMVATILLLVIVAVLILHHRHLAKQNKMLIEQNDKLITNGAIKDKLLSMLGHDLKNPFNALLGFCEVLRMNGGEEEPMKTYINVVYDQSRNVYNLLDNMLQWSRLHRNRIHYLPINVRLKHTINEEVDQLVPSANNKNITLNTDIKTDAPVHVDPYTTAFIVRNLVSNAIKFTKPGGLVLVSLAENANGEVVLTVTDNGIGMSAEELEHVAKPTDGPIEPYSTKGTENEVGTGLGLVLSHIFAHNNGGRMLIESQKDKGSKVSLIFNKAQA